MIMKCTSFLDPLELIKEGVSPQRGRHVNELHGGEDVRVRQ